MGNISLKCYDRRYVCPDDNKIANSYQAYRKIIYGHANIFIPAGSLEIFIRRAINFTSAISTVKGATQ